MSEYCANCHWEIGSHGHYRECIRPKREADEHNRVVKLESDFEAAILKNDELKAKLKDSEGDHRQIHGLQEKLQESARLNEELRKALVRCISESGCAFSASGEYDGCKTSGVFAPAGCATCVARDLLRKTTKRNDVLMPGPMTGCKVCGSKLVMIRGKIPHQPDREICPTCAQERLEDLLERQSPDYGQAKCEAKKP